MSDKDLCCPGEKEPRRGSTPVAAAGGFYNQYYLMELGDNSWLCVYFDDYLTLTETDAYPTGYVRYTTTEERRMLNRMAEDYDVDPAYVLDMFRHGLCFEAKLIN